MHVSKEEGGFPGRFEQAGKMAANESNVFLPVQFENTWNCETHLKQPAQSRGCIPDYPLLCEVYAR